MKERIVAALTVVSRPYLAFALAALASVLFYQKQSQAPVWLAPYLSGAANWSPGDKWMVDPESVPQMKAMSHDERWVHRFEPEEDRSKLTEFRSMDIGWMWCVWAARHVFPFLGDLAAVSLLTLLVHHTLAALFVSKIRCRVTAGLFVVLYLCNPLVMHVMTMPYYYGWQAIASLAVLNMLFAAKEGNARWYLPTLALLLFCAAIRPNVLTLVAPAIFYAAYSICSKTVWVATAAFVACTIFIPKINKPFWHTVYAGLGAYPNRHGLYLSDDSASNAYAKVTGERWSAEIGGKFHDPVFLDRYSKKLKELSLDIVAADPALPIRNAALNSLIVFSWVYKPGMPFWLYLSQALVGLIILAAMVCSWRVTWRPMLGLLLVVGPIVLYFPPIAAYVVGGYCLLALALAYLLAAKFSFSK